MKTNEVGVMLDKNGYAPSVVDPYSDLSKRCYHCDWRGDLVRHEIFNASNRQKSKAYGLWIYLCPRCHMDLHDNPEKWKWLKVTGQRQAMAYYGWTIEDFRESYPDLAQTLYDLSQEEMGHMARLHTAVTNIIEQYRKTKGEPPADMLAVYNYLHKKQIEKAAEVKNLQGMFKEG